LIPPPPLHTWIENVESALVDFSLMPEHIITVIREACQEAYIKSSNTNGVTGGNDTGDYFGGGVAIWGDTLAVGAVEESSAANGVNNSSPGQSDNIALKSGAVYIFRAAGMDEKSFEKKMVPKNAFYR
jgi:hypothetical protein